MQRSPLLHACLRRYRVSDVPFDVNVAHNGCGALSRENRAHWHSLLNPECDATATLPSFARSALLA